MTEAGGAKPLMIHFIKDERRRWWRVGGGLGCDAGAEVPRLTGGQNLYAGARLCRGAAGRRESGQWISEAASNMHAHNVHINRRRKQWPG